MNDLRYYKYYDLHYATHIRTCSLLNLKVESTLYAFSRGQQFLESEGRNILIIYIHKD